MHTGTRLAERTIQSLKNLTKANFEDRINFRGSLDKALHVLRFTIHSEIQKNTFELQLGRKPRTRLTNQKMLIQPIQKTCPSTLHGVQMGEITDQLVMSKKKTNDRKYKRGRTFTEKNPAKYG